jgi:hypothetical protein
VIAHVPPLAPIVLHVLLVMAKSPLSVPVIVALVTITAFVPLLVTVTVNGALVVPTVSSPKFTGEGDIAISLPLPLKAIVCGLMQALSVTTIDPERVPTAAGVKVTDIVHFPPAARLLPHPFAVIVKSLAFVPPTAMLEIVRGAPPGLLSVRFRGALAVLMGVLGNDSDGGEKLVTGAPL